MAIVTVGRWKPSFSGCCSLHYFGSWNSLPNSVVSASYFDQFLFVHSCLSVPSIVRTSVSHVVTQTTLDQYMYMSVTRNFSSTLRTVRINFFSTAAYTGIPIGRENSGEEGSSSIASSDFLECCLLSRESPHNNAVSDFSRYNGQHNRLLTSGALTQPPSWRIPGSVPTIPSLQHSVYIHVGFLVERFCRTHFQLWLVQLMRSVLS